MAAQNGRDSCTVRAQSAKVARKIAGPELSDPERRLPEHFANAFFWKGRQRYVYLDCMLRFKCLPLNSRLALVFVQQVVIVVFDYQWFKTIDYFFICSVNSCSFVFFIAIICGAIQCNCFCFS